MIGGRGSLRTVENPSGIETQKVQVRSWRGGVCLRTVENPSGIETGQRTEEPHAYHRVSER